MKNIFLSTISATLIITIASGISLSASHYLRGKNYSDVGVGMYIYSDWAFFIGVIIYIGILFSGYQFVKIYLPKEFKSVLMILGLATLLPLISLFSFTVSF
jgi:hypothetical protein